MIYFSAAIGASQDIFVCDGVVFENEMTAVAIGVTASAVGNKTLQGEGTADDIDGFGTVFIAESEKFEVGEEPSGAEGTSRAGDSDIGIRTGVGPGKAESLPMEIGFGEIDLTVSEGDRIIVGARGVFFTFFASLIKRGKRLGRYVGNGTRGAGIGGPGGRA